MEGAKWVNGDKERVERDRARVDSVSRGYLGYTRLDETRIVRTILYIYTYAYEYYKFYNRLQRARAICSRNNEVSTSVR